MPPLPSANPPPAPALTLPAASASGLPSETPSASKMAKKSHRRAVSWSSSAEVAGIISIKDYSPTELSATWYDSTEMKSFKLERKHSAGMLEKGAPVECARGLENATKSGSQVRLCNLKQCIGAVLDEQEFQDMDGRENPDLLARVAMVNTIKSQEEAYRRGLKDREESELLNGCRL